MAFLVIPRPAFLPERRSRAPRLARRPMLLSSNSAAGGCSRAVSVSSGRCCRTSATFKAAGAAPSCTAAGATDLALQISIHLP